MSAITTSTVARWAAKNPDIHPRSPGRRQPARTNNNRSPHAMNLLQLLPRRLPGVTAFARAKVAIPNRPAPLPLVAAVLVVLTLATAALLPRPRAGLCRRHYLGPQIQTQGNRTLEEEVSTCGRLPRVHHRPKPRPDTGSPGSAIRIGDGTSTDTLLLSVRLYRNNHCELGDVTLLRGSRR